MSLLKYILTVTGLNLSMSCGWCIFRALLSLIIQTLKGSIISPSSAISLEPDTCGTRGAAEVRNRGATKEKVV